MDQKRKSLGLYLHIPFCREKCVYCDFYSLPRSEDRMDDYVAALQRDLKRTAERAGDYRVDTVYFGGGTPSYLGPERLCRLLETVKDCYTLDPEAEITLEANPDSAGEPGKLRALRDCGFNRISLGMQSASPEELRTIGRIHTPEQVTAAVTAARAAGFDNLSLDLIYGLPDQTMERWQENLAAAVALGPEHLSCYGLKVEPGTPLYAMRSRVTLPGDEEQADMYLYTVEYLKSRGYDQYEISNFTRPGRESRHNLRYWRMEEYAGFGPGAHSDFGGVRYACTRSLADYLAGAAAGDIPHSEEHAIGDEERAAEWIMLGLRTVEGLDSAVFRRRFGLDFRAFIPFLAQCRQAGYAVETAGRWHLTATGFLVSNQIIGGLLDTLEDLEANRG